tara:strand:+ start:328 stop:753 length:426 start_codon:yes stop_codon:yes gene_type:complete
MTTIITDITDNDLLKYYWLPLCYKHQEFDFIFTNGASINLAIQGKPKNARFYKCERIVGVLGARSQSVFLSNQNSIPTYETMIYMQNLTTDVCVRPKYLNGKDSECFSIRKGWYHESVQTAEEYINKYNPKVIEDLTLYKV